MARASTRVFVREGARVLAADISGRQEETAAELGDAVVPFHCDVTKEDQVEAMFVAALDAFGHVDAVLNVAGIGSSGELADVSMDEYDRIMDADLRSVMLGTKHGIRAMLPTGGGVILNWSSTGGYERHTISCERVLGRKSRCHRAHKSCGRRVRHQGHSGHCDLPWFHRDGDVWRSRCGFPTSPTRPGHGAQAGGST